MEDKLIELFKLANLLNEKQRKLYAQIEYVADQKKTIQISIVNKETYSYIQTFKFDLTNNPLLKWNTVINLFNSYIGGASDE